jgi:hypothetical protein
LDEGVAQPGAAELAERTGLLGLPVAQLSAAEARPFGLDGFAAAIGAQVAPPAKPEVVTDAPDRPEELTKKELEELVRPADVGFLKSYPTAS